MGDEGFSSDDLLKQAKDKLGMDDEGVAPVMPEPAVAHPDEPATDAEFFSSLPSVDPRTDVGELDNLAPDDIDVPERPAKSPSEIAAELRHESEPQTLRRPSDFINDPPTDTRPERYRNDPRPLSGPPPVPAPPTEETRPSAPSTPGMPPLPSQPAPKPERRFGIGSLVRFGIVAVIGATVLVGFFDNSTPVQDIAIGECIVTIDPEADEIGSLDTVACTETHEFEVYATPTYDLAAYASDDVMFQLADEMCYNRFASYVGTPFEDSTLWYDYLIPTRSSWDNNGDRSVTCLLFALDAGNTIFPVSSSFRDSGR